MSAIAGIWNSDGHPVSQTHVTTLVAQSRVAGPHSQGVVTPLPELMLQAHILRFDALSAAECQPLIFGRGSVLTWDGRLDNRDDLLLTLHRDLRADTTDAALVAAAYTRWGLESLPRLIGDWSLAIWDAANHTTVLARDYMGNRPLFYRQMNGTLAWASRRDALAACFDLYTQPADAYIVGSLTLGPPSDITPFETLRILRPGHVLVASRDETVIRRYWTFSPKEIRYRRHEEYTDHLRELLKEAVRVRLRSDQRIWAHLSGGWDSSAVVCLAQALIQRGLVEAPALQPISMVCTGSPESDESPFIEVVERWCGLRSTRREFPTLPTFRDWGDLLHPASDLAAILAEPLEGPIQAEGGGIVLTGEPGDVVMRRNGNRLGLLEPLRKGRVFQFWRLCAARAAAKERFILSILGGLALESCLPPDAYGVLRQGLRAWDPARRTSHGKAAMYGVPPAILARASATRPPQYPSSREFPLAKRRIVDWLYSYTSVGVTSSDLSPHIWRVHPYTHRPLVEFTLAVPELALWQPNCYRFGMKMALGDILPPEILSRTDKLTPVVSMTRARRAHTNELLRMGVLTSQAREWELVKRGYVDEGALGRALVARRTDAPLIPDLRDQWLTLEAWLRSVNRLAHGARQHPSVSAPTQRVHETSAHG